MMDIEKFVTRELQANYADLRAVQFPTALSTLVYIECTSREVAENLAEKSLLHSINCGKQQFPIPVYIKDDTVEVRISDLPLEVGNNEIKKTISQYGKALTIVNEK